jgi:lipopolysaccharide transport system permease protein
MGLLWSLLTPLLMLAVFTLVFGYALGSRWGGAGLTAESRSEFAVVLFAGLIVFWMFSDCVSRAPRLLLENPDYIRRRVFPVEILPVVTLASASFHFGVSLSVLLLAQTVLRGLPPVTVLWVPLIIAPFGLLTLGLCWFLASLGVFIRDIGHGVGIVVNAAIFLSPTFYPLTIFPETIRPFLYLNPVTLTVTELRQVLFSGGTPDWPALVVYLAVSWATAWLGLTWFMKSRSAFSDVV